MGVLAALTTVLCWSCGIFPFTEAARRFGSGPLNQYRLLLGWLLITLISCIYLQVSPITLASTPTKEAYFYLGLSGLVGFTIGDLFTFNSFKILGPKLSSLYTTMAPCSALIFGIILLNEQINFIGVFGILITISGVIWLTLSKKDSAEAKEKGFERSAFGIVSGIIGALCQGCGLVLSKMGFNAMTSPIEPINAVWVRLLFAFVGAIVLAILTNKFISNAKTVFRNENKGLRYMVAGTFFGPVCGVTCSLIAINHMKVAEAQTIFALLPIFVLPLNYFFYKEKISLASIFACLTAISGVMMLIWREEISRVL
jgi:drug/metabolite transporter (DMT)-like permease